MAEPPFGHESSAISTRPVLRVGVIIAVTVIVAVTALGLILTHWIAPNRAQIVFRASIPPAPRLQPDPHADLEALRAQKQALLSGWAWVDATHEFARIPIDRAMTLYAQQHAAANDTGTRVSGAASR